ncbi:kelch domain-containing protein 7A [Zonotrichia albicollis]|uniref:kelch domain-containing protein 7A n=1 Tax=Zonotrichia albicollis TaxID=44394 RepID=UPI003D811F4C
MRSLRWAQQLFLLFPFFRCVTLFKAPQRSSSSPGVFSLPLRPSPSLSLRFPGQQSRPWAAPFPGAQPIPNIRGSSGSLLPALPAQSHLVPARRAPASPGKSLIGSSAFPHGKMPQRVPPAWHSDMPLPGKLLLSAAALLLLSLAFRFYRNRSPPPGKIPPGEQRENRDGDGALRRRRRRKDGGDKCGNGPGMQHEGLWGEQSFARNEEEEEEEGEELGSELIPSKASLSPAGMERELGRELGWKLGIKSESEAGVELGGDPGSRMGSEPGKEPGSEVGSQPGSKSGSRLGIKPGNTPGKKPGSKLIMKPVNELGSEQTNELGNKLGKKLGIKSGIELGNEAGSKLESKAGIEVGSEPESKLGSEPGSRAEILLGSEPGILLRSDLGSKAGVEVGSEPGMSLGSELGSHDPGAVAAARGSPAGTDAAAPSSGRSPGIPDARTEGDGCAQSAERDAAGAGRSREGSTGSVRTLSVTSSLGLLLTASEAGSDTSYCFSSVAKIQVEENFIPERQDKDRDSPPRPGLRGKVYDYFVQSTSESVSKRTSLPFVPAGTSQCHRERDQAEPRGSGTQGENPALEIPDPDTSSAPQEGTENLPEPPSPGWKSSTPQLPLPGGAPAAGPEPSQVSLPAQVHLGNCSEVLRAAKAQQLRALQDTALQVMSANLLQVLRSPNIYGRLNAGERELLPALRSRGRPRLVVADVPPAEPGHRRGRLCYYDEDGDRWCQLCQLPAGVAGRGCAVCSMFNYLFLVPGWEGTGRARSPSRRVLCYDPLSDSWCDICPLRQARPHCQLVALDGHLYAIGGECLATVERYDPRRDRWAFSAALPRDTFAVAHAATACDGDIYVTGGTLRSLLLRYDARGDSWAASPAVGDKDRTAELVSAHGFLYRFQLRRGAGGTEVAVSRCSASARLWYRCGSRPLPEPAGLRCAALGGLVHCLGRGFHLRFLADPVSPRFGAKELRPFPEPHGSLLPAVLVLPEGGTETPQP